MEKYPGSDQFVGVFLIDTDAEGIPERLERQGKAVEREYADSKPQQYSISYHTIFLRKQAFNITVLIIHTKSIVNKNRYFEVTGISDKMFLAVCEELMVALVEVYRMKGQK